MNFLKNFFGSLNKDELIFDIIIVISSIIVQKLMINEIIAPKELPAIVFLVFSFLFTCSLSYMMGTFFQKYETAYSEYKDKRNLPIYLAWLIFPGIFMIPMSAIPKYDLGKYVIFYIMAVILISVVVGYRIETGNTDYKKIANRIAMYFSALTLSVIETTILIAKSMSKHPEEDALPIIIGLIAFGYIPYRLVIAFSPPVNKRNLIFALPAVVISLLYFIIY